MTTTTIYHHAPTQSLNAGRSRWNPLASAVIGTLTFLTVGFFVGAAGYSLLFDTPSAVALVSAGVFPAAMGSAMLSLVILMMFYVYSAAQNPNLGQRAAWMAFLIVMPFIAMPVYWWTHMQIESLGARLEARLLDRRHL